MLHGRRVAMNNILVTGGAGLVGSAMKRQYPDATYVSSVDFDLTNPTDVLNMFTKYNPTHVIHLAGRVGGVAANIAHPVEFFEENVLINTNVMRYAHQFNVERLTACMSTCVFPDTVEYPLQPHKIHLGEPHQSNYAYAYAKRMIDIQMRAYQQQYGRKWLAVIPTNVYGPDDNYNLINSHVIPALIHKCYLAKINNTPLDVWGGGKAIREFIYSDDVARVIWKLTTETVEVDPIIISSPFQYSIGEVVQKIVQLFGFTGEVKFQFDQPEGQHRKPSDISLLLSMELGKFTPLDIGLQHTISWFIDNYDTARK